MQVLLLFDSIKPSLQAHSYPLHSLFGRSLQSVGQRDSLKKNDVHIY